MPEVHLPMQQRYAGDALTLTLSRRERELRIPFWFQFSETMPISARNLYTNRQYTQENRGDAGTQARYGR